MGWPPMVIRIRDAGHDVCVLARNDDAITGAESAGVRQAGSISEVTAHAEAVIVFATSVGEFVGKDVAVVRAVRAELDADLASSAESCAHLSYVTRFSAAKGADPPIVSQR